MLGAYMAMAIPFECHFQFETSHFKMSTKFDPIIPPPLPEVISAGQLRTQDIFDLGNGEPLFANFQFEDDRQPQWRRSLPLKVILSTWKLTIITIYV
jgi:hypothetical protein